MKKCVKVGLCDSFSALKLESDEGTQKQIMCKTDITDDWMVKVKPQIQLVTFKPVT